MLIESFIATVSPAGKSTTNASVKDAGIFLHEYLPLSALRATFKKSSTPTNCLAISASHIFAAQTEKAVVHIYSRARGNQEAVVPFPERIHSIALAGDFDGAGVLLLGTEGGRVTLWEFCTGRQVSTPQSHLQPTSCLVVDPTSNYLLSGSADSSIHLWAIPSLLSFSARSGNDSSLPSPFSPLKTLSSHRAAITALVFGHSFSNTNVAISASRDNSVIVWDYLKGSALKTFLLPTTPLCLALDPADRAVYVGYENGSVQLIDFYENPTVLDKIHDDSQQSVPIQPPPTNRWSSPQDSSATLSIQVSYDGTSILSGHQNGQIYAWNIAKGTHGKPLTDLCAPVTNLQMLPVTGFSKVAEKNLKVHQVIKPRYESSFGGNLPTPSAIAPANYNLTAQFASSLPLPRFSSSTTTSDNDFQSALHHLSFPTPLLEEGIAEFTSLTPHTSSHHTTALVSLDGTTSPPPSTQNDALTLLQRKNEALASQVASLEFHQERTLDQFLAMKKQLAQMVASDEAKAIAKSKRRTRRAEEGERIRKRIMGEEIADEEMEEGEEESSSTDEMTPSD